MSIVGRFAGVLVVAVAAIACGAADGVGAGPGLPAPTATLRPYTPPLEEELSESLTIADMTVEEVIEMHREKLETGSLQSRQSPHIVRGCLVNQQADPLFL